MRPLRSTPYLLPDEVLMALLPTSSRLALVAAAFLATSASLSQAAVSTVSLNTPDSTSFTDNLNTLFSLTATQPAGSGVFLPFVRIQREGDAQGYNTTADTGANATMDVINLPGASKPTLAMNNVVTQDNKVLLTLDYNEQGASGKSLITLQELVLVVSTNPNKTGAAGPGHNDAWSIQSIPADPGDQILYTMSSATTGTGNPFVIQLNADKNAANGNGGSGAADLNVDVDLSHITNLQSILDSSHYLYVYSRFSGTGAGYEEWSSYMLNPPSPGNSGGGQPIPEPASLTLLALGAAALMARRRA